nr:phage tail tape measure protein [uncultured Eisenbergiella sp.]
MENDKRLLLIAALDETKSEKKIRQQLATMQKRLQKQSQIKLNVKIDEKVLEQQANLKQSLESVAEISDELNTKLIDLGKTITKIDDDPAPSNLKKNLSEITEEATVTGKAGKNLGDIFKGAMSKLSEWNIKDRIKTQVQESIKELKGIDTLLTDIGKTGNLTKNQLQQLGNSSFETASTYGKKASDYLSGVKKMADSGYTGDQGKNLAEQSLLAQTAGNMTAETADKYILALNAAYKFNGEAKRLNEVLDGQTSIATHNNISLNNLAEAMSTIGTAASGYRVTVEELSAMIGTIGSVTHGSGNEIGNSISSILSNLQDTTSSDVVDTLNAVHVSMTEMVDGSEQLRDPISILRDLSDAYNQLGDSDSLKGELLTSIGGSEQSEELDALLQNMSSFDQMLTDYAAGSGSAMEAAMSSADSWEGSLNRLSNTWTDTVGNIANSDAIISGINALNSLLEMVNKLTDFLGPAGSLAVAGGLLAGIKNVGRVKMLILIKNMPTVIKFLIKDKF